MFTAELHTVI